MPNRGLDYPHIMKYGLSPCGTCSVSAVVVVAVVVVVVIVLIDVILVVVVVVLLVVPAVWRQPTVACNVLQQG